MAGRRRDRRARALRHRAAERPRRRRHCLGVPLATATRSRAAAAATKSSVLSAANSRARAAAQYAKWSPTLALAHKSRITVDLGIEVAARSPASSARGGINISLLIFETDQTIDLNQARARQRAFAARKSARVTTAR